MANLGDLSAELKQKVEAGAMVKSVTQLTGGGRRIEFTSGNPIEVSNIASNTEIRIGTNGNWFLNGMDTGIPAAGKDGTPGADGRDGSAVNIGANVNWYIDSKDTGILDKCITGEKGDKGDPGAAKALLPPKAEAAGGVFGFWEKGSIFAG